MQSMWAGTLAFGLAEIPVRLGPATRPRELAFRQVHAALRETFEAMEASKPAGF